MHRQMLQTRRTGCLRRQPGRRVWTGTSAASECGRHDDSPAERDRQKHGANKTTTAFIKANKKAFISYGLPEDDLTAAAVECPPLLSWHSPKPVGSWRKPVPIVNFVNASLPLTNSTLPWAS